MKRWLLVLTVVLVGCSTVNNGNWGKASASSNGVSIVELVAHGTQFDGWSISVIGVIYYDQENSLLFLNREAYRVFDSASSIQVDISSNLDRLGITREKLIKLSGKYVVVEGEYEDISRERLQSKKYVLGPDYAGRIRAITRLSVIE